ncbi:MAG: YraN family protein [Acidobacteriota bacterium]
MCFFRRARGSTHRRLSTRERGRLGEDAAVRWLQGRGYRILERNVHVPGGELDVVALQEGTVCFIEVKARRTRSFGGGVDALGPEKCRRIARAAAWWCRRRSWTGPCRFDLLALDRDGGRWRMTLLENAFEAPDRGW